MLGSKCEPEGLVLGSDLQAYPKNSILIVVSKAVVAEGSEPTGATQAQRSHHSAYEALLEQPDAFQSDVSEVQERRLRHL